MTFVYGHLCLVVQVSAHQCMHASMSISVSIEYCPLYENTIILKVGQKSAKHFNISLNLCTKKLKLFVTFELSMFMIIKYMSL